MWDKLIEIFTAVPLWELALIFFAKIVEVTMGTLRIILINKGYRKQGVILSFIEIVLWVFVASRVINGITEAPIKGIVYSLGFSAGVYTGSRIESWLAFGRVLVQIITSGSNGDELTNTLRKEGYGVTTINAHGKDDDRLVLMVYTDRKKKAQVIKRIQSIDSKAMIVINDVSTMGGYFSPWRQLVK
ncbi:MAG: DUF2179 domain-containing protein [Bacilli bacterium]|nr:DUF2179 domain-containing protein [Bacilli bacterium]